MTTIEHANETLDTLEGIALGLRCDGAKQQAVLDWIKELRRLFRAAGLEVENE